MGVLRMLMGGPLRTTALKVPEVFVTYGIFKRARRAIYFVPLPPSNSVKATLNGDGKRHSSYIELLRNCSWVLFGYVLNASPCLFTALPMRGLQGMNRSNETNN